MKLNDEQLARCAGGEAVFLRQRPLYRRVLSTWWRKALRRRPRRSRTSPATTG